MAKVTTYSDLLKQLEKVRNQAIKNVAKNDTLTDVVKERIQKDVYDSYTPTMYERTYELKESVVANVIDDRNSPTIRIDHDESKMNHTSIVNGTDVSHMLPQWISSGDIPNIFNNNHYIWQDSRSYMENAVEELKDGKFKDEIKKELKNMGVKSV